jgi:hypothetical protein
VRFGSPSRPRKQAPSGCGSLVLPRAARSSPSVAGRLRSPAPGRGSARFTGASRPRRHVASAARRRGSVRQPAFGPTSTPRFGAAATVAGRGSHSSTSAARRAASSSEETAGGRRPRVPSLPSGMRSTDCARASVRARVDIGPAAPPLRRLADGSTARARTHPGASGLRARPPSCVHLSSRTCECGEAMSVVSTGSAFGPTSWGGPRPLSAWATAPIGFGRADAVSHRVASGSASADLGASRGVPHPASRRMTDVHRPSGPTSVGLGVPRGSRAVDTNGPWRRPSGQSSGHPVHGEEVREPEGPFGDPRFRLLCIGRCFAIEVFGPRARDTRGCFRVCQRQQRPAAVSFGSGTPERCSTSFGGLVHRGTATVGPTSVGRPAHRLRPIRSVTSRSSRWCKTRLATLVRRFADAEGSA